MPATSLNVILTSIRFDVMEASEEELTPEDVIMRDMMLANGNQINYMA